MPKRTLKPAVALFPVPVALITVGDSVKSNIITLAWVGTVCSQPPMVGISIRPGRHSVEMLKANGEFVVNLPGERLTWTADRCGMISGRDVDKWKESTLTPMPAAVVKPPLISQCPVNMECVVRQVIPLGTHELYLGEIVALHADEAILDANGRISPELTSPIAYHQAEYWSLGKKLGVHGYSTKK